MTVAQLTNHGAGYFGTFADWAAYDALLLDHQTAFYERYGLAATQLMDVGTINLRLEAMGLDHVIEYPPPTEQPPSEEAPTMLTPPAAEQQGGLLLCTTGTWDGNPTSYTYQWKNDGVNTGTGANEYTIVDPDDVGHTFTCDVTAVNAVGGTMGTSNAVIAETPA